MFDSLQYFQLSQMKPSVFAFFILFFLSFITVHHNIQAASFTSKDNIYYLSMGTGVIEGTYYPIGKSLANLISHPPDLPPCKPDQACGVEGLVAAAYTTQGSLDNIEAMISKKFQSILCQSDIAYLAYHGQDFFLGQKPAKNLRAIANLYTESIHIVVSKKAHIKSIKDLKNKRISVGKKNSGTIIHAKKILSHFHLKDKDFKNILNVNLGIATDLLRQGKLDAFFMTGGYPVLAIKELAEEDLIELLTINEEDMKVILKKYPFFDWQRLPDGIYKNIKDVNLLTISALWLIDQDVPEELVFGITKSLWHPDNRKKLNQGHHQGPLIQYEKAQTNISIPLHEGAKRFYNTNNISNP